MHDFHGEMSIVETKGAEKWLKAFRRSNYRWKRKTFITQQRAKKGKGGRREAHQRSVTEGNFSKIPFKRQTKMSTHRKIVGLLLFFFYYFVWIWALYIGADIYTEPTVVLLARRVCYACIICSERNAAGRNIACTLEKHTVYLPRIDIIYATLTIRKKR